VYQKLTGFVDFVLAFVTFECNLTTGKFIHLTFKELRMKKLFVAMSMIALSASVSFAGPIEDREAAMKGMAKAVGTIAPFVKEEAPFDAAAVAAALTALNESAQKIDVAVMFPAGSTGESASPKIWENLADFQAKMDQLKVDTAAGAAAPAADLAALKTQFGTITKNCGGCHELYRIKKG
jgi:cytochrome c556